MKATVCDATSRIADCFINTVTKLLIDVGAACSQYQHETPVNLPCKHIKCDEIWSFCYSKEKNVPKERKGEYGIGDVYTWPAICADTKLVPSFLVGNRTAEYANAFALDLKSRLSNQVQLTINGLKLYLNTIEGAFGGVRILIKIYGSSEAISDDRNRWLIW